MHKLGAVMSSRNKSLIISLVGMIKRRREIGFRRIYKFSWCSLINLLTLTVNLDTKLFAHYASLYLKNEYHVCAQKLNFALDSLLRSFVHLFLLAYCSFWFFQGVRVPGLMQKLFVRWEKVNVVNPVISEPMWWYETFENRKKKKIFFF